MTTRRSFMASILAAGMAPATVGSGILMPVRKIILPRTPEWGTVIDGDLIVMGSMVVHDTSYFLQVGPDGRITGFGLNSAIQ